MPSRKRWQYQRLAAPIAPDAAPPPAEVLSWQQPPSQPWRNHAVARLARYAVVAAAPFLFAPVAADAAPPPTDQPQSAISQPRAEVQSRAHLAPYYFAGIEADAQAPAATQPQSAVSQPQRQVRGRSHLGPYYFAPIAADVAAPTPYPLQPTSPQPDRRVKPRQGQAYFGPLTAAPAAPTYPAQPTSVQPDRRPKARPSGAYFAPPSAPAVSGQPPATSEYRPDRRRAPRAYPFFFAPIQADPPVGPALTATAPQFVPSRAVARRAYESLFAPPAAGIAAVPAPITFFGDSDIDFMLSESPTLATIGGVTAPVFIDPVGDPTLAGAAASIQATRILVTAKTGQFPDLHPGVLITINGTDYTATDVKRSGDGALSLVLCELA